MGEVIVALLVLGAFIWLANKATAAARAVDELQSRVNLLETELRVLWREREPRPPVVPPAAEPAKPAPVVAPPPVSVTVPPPAKPAPQPVRPPPRVQEAEPE